MCHDDIYTWLARRQHFENFNFTMSTRSFPFVHSGGNQYGIDQIRVYFLLIRVNITDWIYLHEKRVIGFIVLKAGQPKAWYKHLCSTVDKGLVLCLTHQGHHMARQKKNVTSCLFLFLKSHQFHRGTPTLPTELGVLLRGFISK